MQDHDYDVFLEGLFVNLVALSEDLVEKTSWYKWFNNESLTINTQHHCFPNTKAKQLKYFKEEIENNRHKLQLGIVEKSSNNFIGVISLSNIDYINRKCEIGGMIGERGSQNLKHFTESCSLLIKHAFDNLNMNKVYGGTLIKEISLLFIRVLGFKDEGIDRNTQYKNGTYHDAYKLGLCREEYYKKDPQ